MYLDVGGDAIVRSADVIAVLDAASGRKGRESSRLSRFLEGVIAAGRMRDVSGGGVKSYVITDEYVYASSISSATLRKRVESSYRERSATGRLFDIPD